jgi:hypothetical protein
MWFVPDEDYSRNASCALNLLSKLFVDNTSVFYIRLARHDLVYVVYLVKQMCIVSVWLLFNIEWGIVFCCIMARTSYITMLWWWCSLCSSSLKQPWLAGRHVAPLGQIALMSNQSVFALISSSYVLLGKTVNTNSSHWFVPTRNGTQLHASSLIITVQMCYS